MPVADADIVAYAAANKPTDDSSTNGGAIDLDERIIFTDLAADDSLEVVSSNAGDTMNITVSGRKPSGEVAQQTVALNGTTPVALSTLSTVRAFHRALLASDAAGTVTVRRASAGPTVGTIPAGERGFRRLFINAVSDPGGAKNYYEKVFLRNTHATLSALNASVAQSADPTAKVTHLLAAAKGDSATSTNRLTAPGASDTLDPDTFDDNSKNVPGTNLAAGEHIGVWLRFALGTGEAPIDSTYTLALNFSTA